MGSHKMETSLKCSRKSRRRRKKKANLREPELTQNSKSPTRNLGIRKPTIKRKEANKVKTVTRQYLNSIIEGFCEEQISIAENQKKDCGQPKRNMFEETVDLCDDDSVVNDSNSSLLIVPSFKPLIINNSNQKKTEVVIDLSNDLTEQNEVVDLTEPHSMPHGDCSVLGPTVIDLSEDESKDKPKLKPDNDDILVIGTFNKKSNISKNGEISPFIQLSDRWNNLNNIINCSHKLKKKYLKKQSVLDRINNKSKVQCGRESLRKTSSSSKVAKIGENIYVDSPVVLPSCGLRPIIIDGSNVAFVHSNSNFCCKRLEICINYFKKKGHKVTAFVPQFRLNSHRSDDPQLLRKLERQGDVILTPSKKIDGRNIVPYDDRFIVQTAALKGGIIVTRDNYNDLLKENPAWAETIKYRTLAFTWVDDVLMFPKDPLGEHGPSLEEFLRFQ